jgi:macrolide transport system ATP-binding/permease protein
MSQLNLQNLSLSYVLNQQLTPVLNCLDLKINSGEMIAILGPSGSGKSTLLYILGCLLRPTTGHYSIDGIELSELNEMDLAELRNRHFGFIFQQFHLLPRANLVENLLLGTRYNRGDIRSQSDLKSQAESLLIQMGLGEHLHHQPHQLSGGQQQRVAIARALMNDPSIILADEPTGNLDSKSANLVLDLLRRINQSGKTVIIITHDHDIANKCDRVISVLDGKIVSSVASPTRSTSATAKIQDLSPRPLVSSSSLASSQVRTQTQGPSSRIFEDARTAWQNLLRNKSRSLLTMLGVIIGVAAVLSTITLGSYTKDKILQSYESLGVNKLVVRVYKKWNLRAKDATGVRFEEVDPRIDLNPMRRLFPEITLISPVVHNWVQSADFAGKSFEQPQILGVSEEYFAITNRKVILGRPLSQYHINNQSNVCVIGHDIATRLFSQQSPLRQILQIQGSNNSQFSCLILGVLNSQTSNNEWSEPNKQILLPSTFLKVVGDRWNSKIREFNVTIQSGASIESLGEKIKQYFHMKYGRSAEVHIDSDEILVAQMRRFLNLFTILLTGVALISLAVGGIGIANMMLVSVAERYKEIGLRKALGATNDEIRTQFLVEAMILCGIAGGVGVFIGICGYHIVLYLASKLFPQIKFEWVFNFWSIALAFVSIVAVGLLSGIVPALRAQKLQVIEALRSE